MPCGRTLLGGLAEEEAELLQTLGKDVLARHGEKMASQTRKKEQEGRMTEGYREFPEYREQKDDLFAVSMIRPAEPDRRQSASGLAAAYLILAKEPAVECDEDSLWVLN